MSSCCCGTMRPTAPRLEPRARHRHKERIAVAGAKPLLASLICLLCLVAMLAIPPARHKAAPSILDRHFYSRQLGLWRIRLLALRTPQQARHWAGMVPRAWQVRSASYQVTVPAAWLKNGLQIMAAEPSILAAERRLLLAHINEQLRRALQASGPSHLFAREARARRILTRPEFALRGPGFWARVRLTLANAIMRFLAWAFGRTPALGPTSGRALLALLFLGALALSTWGLLRRPPRLRPHEPAPVKRPAPWLERAWQAAEAGEFQSALELAYQASLEACATRGWWRFDPSATPREFLRRLPETLLARPPLQNLVVGIEAQRYRGAFGEPQRALMLLQQLEATFLDARPAE